MHNSTRRISVVALLLSIVGLAAPFVLLRLPGFLAAEVSPRDAMSFLNVERKSCVLLDVRSQEEFDAEHVAGAVNLPLPAIEERGVRALVESGIGPDNRVLVICQSGFRSAMAARRLTELGYSRALSVTGGLEAWSRESCAEGGICSRLKRPSGDVVGRPFRALTPFEEAAAFASAAVIKPIYVSLSLVVIVLLWNKRSTALVSLKWAMIFFFIGENFCTVNFLLFADNSALFELWHSVGMAFCFGFTTYCLMDVMDARIVQCSIKDKKCALLGFCRSCAKYTDVSCGLQKVFLFLCPAFALLALMPLCGRPVWVSYDSSILGTVYNFFHATLYQYFETRICPVLACGFFLAATLILVVKKENPIAVARPLFVAGMGAMGFSWLRFIMFRCYRENLVWFVFWEELTEFLLVIGVLVILDIFSRQLKESECSANC